MADQTAEGLYAVEELLAKRGKKGKREYLVKWRDYAPADNTWEPVANLSQCKFMIAAFEAKYAKGRRRLTQGNGSNAASVVARACPTSTSMGPAAIPAAAQASQVDAQVATPAYTFAAPTPIAPQDAQIAPATAAQAAAPSFGIAAPVPTFAAPVPITPPATQNAPAAIPTAPAAAAPSAGNVQVVTGQYMVGRQVVKILGIASAAVRTTGGDGQMLCYRCRFDDGTVRFLPQNAIKETPEARLPLIEFLEEHLNYK